MTTSSSRITQFAIGGWRVRPSLNEISGPGGSPEGAVQILPRSMDVLVYLAQRPGKVHSKERIMAAVWGEAFVTDAVLTQAIWELRKAFGDDAKSPRFIQTVPKKGYRLVAPVSIEPDPETPSLPSLEPADRVHHYELLEELGAGGSGVVYKARDTKLERTVALKFLAPERSRDLESKKRFLREARAASALDHPNICNIHEIHETSDGQLFLAMAYYEGETLAQKIAGGPLALEEAVDLAFQLAEGLSKAHARGIVHRDIKPANIIVTSDGVAKILDFGLAKLQEVTQLTKTGTTLGTVAYMSPEQTRGQQLDSRTDLFSFGTVLYEMSTGQRPFEGTTAALIYDAILHHTPTPPTRLNPELPVGVEQIICKCLEKDRDERYQSADDFRADLARQQGDGDSSRVIVSSEVRTKASVRAKRRKLGLAAAVGLALVGALAVWQQRKPQALTERDSVLVTDFVNTTGDPIFDYTLRQALAVKLEESPFLEVVPEERVQRTLEMMNRSGEERITRDLGREVCQRQNGKAMVTGAIAALGSRYVLTLTTLECQTGDALAREQVEAERKEDVLQALGVATTRLRRELGESLASIEEHDAPVEEATTSSLEALQAFSLGGREYARGRQSESMPFFERAVELDPNFAGAYVLMGFIHGNRGEYEKRDEYITRAFQLRERVTEREKLSITFLYYTAVTGELHKGRGALELFNGTYPQYQEHNDLGLLYVDLGQFEEALVEFEEGLRDSPTDVPYSNLGTAHMLLNQFDEAKAVLEKGIAQGIESGRIHTRLIEIAYLEGDEEAMERHSAWAMGRPREPWALHLLAQAAASSGRLREARELSRRAVESALRSDYLEPAAFYSGLAAWREALFGNDREAQTGATAAIAISNRGRWVLEFAARTFARVGSLEKAEALVEELTQSYPTDTLVNSVSVPGVRAEVELRLGNPARAVEILRAATPYERWHWYAIFLRAEAYLRLGQGDKAAAEFEKFLKLRGVKPLAPEHSLAHLGLGRALALASDKAGAKIAYQDFLALWKDADPDIPILQQAQAEFASLD